MTPTQQKIGIAVALLAGCAALAVVWLRQSERSAVPAISPSVTETATHSVTPDTAAAMVHPEDVIVVEPDDAEASNDENNDGEKDHDRSAIRPSQKVIDAIREAKKPTPDEGQVTVNPDGSEKLSLGNRYMSAPVATVDKDGKVHVDYHGEKYTEEEIKKNNTEGKR